MSKMPPEWDDVHWEEVDSDCLVPDCIINMTQECEGCGTNRPTTYNPAKAGSKWVERVDGQLYRYWLCHICDKMERDAAWSGKGE